MRRMTLSLAVVGLIAMLSGAARAQDTTVSKGEVAIPTSFPALVASYQHFPATLEAIKKQPAIKGGDVTLIDATALATGQSDQLLKVMLEKHAAHIAELQKLLAAQAAVTGLLAKESPPRTVADVIAADAKADGKMVIYYQAKKG